MHIVSRASHLAGINRGIANPPRKAERHPLSDLEIARLALELKPAALEHQPKGFIPPGLVIRQVCYEAVQQGRPRRLHFGYAPGDDGRQGHVTDPAGCVRRHLEVAR